jgi:hypothetical protein
MAKVSESKTRGPELSAWPGKFDPSAFGNIEPLLQASNKLLDAWMAVGTEILEFSKTRLDQNIEMSKALAQSGSLNEAMDLQAKFARSMMQDCLSEANKIVDLSTRTIFDSISTLGRAEPTSHAQAAE